MKKDYIPIDSINADLHETDFIEQYWAAVWHTNEGYVRNQHRVEDSEQYPIIQRYLQQLTVGSMLLDGGCGLGHWTITLRNQGFNVIGVDISRQTIKKLQTFFPDMNFRIGDIRKLDFPDNFVDGYLSWGTFEHFEEGLGSPINEAWRILKPGGFLFIDVPYQNWRHIFCDACRLEKWDSDYIPSGGYRPSLRFYQWRFTKSELRRELEMRKFQVHETQLIDKSNGAKRFLHGLGISQKKALGKVMRHLLKRVLPANCIAHMILVVAQKKA